MSTTAVPHTRSTTTDVPPDRATGHLSAVVDDADRRALPTLDEVQDELVDPWPRKVLMVCSTGGHLAQLLRLEPWYAHRERTWVTFDKPDGRSLLADEDTIWAYHPTTRNLRNLLRNLWLAVSTVRRMRPDVIVSSGAAVAWPFFVVGKLLGAKNVFVEVYDRIDSSTMTGRLSRPITDAFLVQWDEQQVLYRDTQVIGRLL